MLNIAPLLAVRYAVGGGGDKPCFGISLVFAG